MVVHPVELRFFFSKICFWVGDVVVVVLTLSRIIKSVITGQAPVILEWENIPGQKHKQTKSGSYIIAEAILASAKTYVNKSVIGSQPTTREAQTGVYV